MARQLRKVDLRAASVMMGELEACGVRTVLFGSLGVSIYLGSFKEFGDIDLLIDQKWVEGEWSELQNIMGQLGFELVDEREHEFHNDIFSVAFAPMSIFERDGIEFDSKRDIVEVDVEGATLKTFTPELFRRVYEYSMKDGYRKEKRGKKDQEIVTLLNEYIRSRT